MEHLGLSKIKSSEIEKKEPKHRNGYQRNWCSNPPRVGVNYVVWGLEALYFLGKQTRVIT